MRFFLYTPASNNNTIVFHDDGTFSYRLDGKWIRRVAKITWTHASKLPNHLRAKLWYEETRRGSEIVIKTL
jgi:hypothetical protein